MKVMLTAIEDFFLEAPLDEVRIAVTSKGNAIRAGKHEIPTRVYKVIVTAAKEKKLFEYEELIGEGIFYDEEQLKKLHERAWQRHNEIIAQMESRGFSPKPGRIESV